MNKKYLEFITNLFGSGTAPSQEDIMKLMEETMTFFRGMKEKMDSPDEEKKKEALDELLEVKTTLEGKMKELSQKTGLSPEQLAAFSQSLLGSRQQDAIQRLSERLQGAASFAGK